jgi:hypothetical protein
LLLPDSSLGCAACLPAFAGGFFSGASYSFISAAPTPGTNPLMPAFSAGVVFALFQGAFFLVNRK